MPHGKGRYQLFTARGGSIPFEDSLFTLEEHANLVSAAARKIKAATIFIRGGHAVIKRQFCSRHCDTPLHQLPLEIQTWESGMTDLIN